MKTLLSLALVLCACLLLSFREKNNKPADENTLFLIGYKWWLQKQIYANRDQFGKDSNTVAGTKNDYIKFGADGKALVAYQGHYDTLSYKINGALLQMGDTPYHITLTENKLTLYQNEEDATGAYNRIWLELKR